MARGVVKHLSPTDSFVAQTGTEVIEVPPSAAATLEGFADSVRRTPGVDLGELPPISHLVVRTENTLYRIVVVSPGASEILVEGGRFFPAFMRARLDGSSFGGALLKVAWLGVGLRMEICCNGQRIVTSPVRSFEIQPEAATTH
jgi:hypothetical protein